MKHYFYFYIMLMNLLGFGTMGLDKKKAQKKKWRISEKTLFSIAVLGGAWGSTLGMFVFHHKTKHWYFRYGFPCLVLLWGYCIYRIICL